MTIRILSGSYPYGKLALLYDYLKFVSNAIAENKLSRSSGKVKYSGTFLEFRIAFVSYVQLLTLIEEIFIAQVYKVSLQNNQPTIIDCGSHIGISILYFKKVFPKCTIKAFEPDPELFLLLRENIDQNRFENVSAFNLALSDTAGHATLFKDKNPESLLSKHHIGSNALSMNFKSEKLSTFVENEVDLVKMDVEGSEDVIVNELVASKTIARIRQFVIEFHPQLQARPVQQFVSQLEQSGFGVTYKKDKSRPGISDYLVYAKKSGL